MPDTPETVLKPCPLCASEQVTTAPDREFGDVTWDVICKACGVRVARDLEADAVAAWNRRARTPSSAPEVSKLVERLRKRVRVTEYGDSIDVNLMDEAATALETLEARVRELEEALREAYLRLVRLGDDGNVCLAALLKQLSGDEND